MSALQDLERARNTFCSNTELHACFLVTPPREASDICTDWQRCCQVINSLGQVLCNATLCAQFNLPL